MPDCLHLRSVGHLVHFVPSHLNCSAAIITESNCTLNYGNLSWARGWLLSAHFVLSLEPGPSVQAAIASLFLLCLKLGKFPFTLGLCFFKDMHAIWLVAHPTEYKWTCFNRRRPRHGKTLKHIQNSQGKTWVPNSSIACGDWCKYINTSGTMPCKWPSAVRAIQGSNSNACSLASLLQLAFTERGRCYLRNAAPAILTALSLPQLCFRYWKSPVPFLSRKCKLWDAPFMIVYSLFAGCGVIHKAWI